jgi:hypothetical protein
VLEAFNCPAKFRSNGVGVKGAGRAGYRARCQHSNFTQLGSTVLDKPGARRIAASLHYDRPQPKNATDAVRDSWSPQTTYYVALRTRSSEIDQRVIGGSGVCAKSVGQRAPIVPRQWC